MSSLKEVDRSRLVPLSENNKIMEVDRSRLIPIGGKIPTQDDISIGSTGIPEPEFDPDSEDMSWGKTLVEAFQNTPSSAWNYATDIAKMVTPEKWGGYGPLNTIKGMKDLAGSFGMKLVSGKQKDEELADSVIEFYKKRYGTEEEFKKQFAEDPIGILSDFSSIMMLGGGALSTAGKVGRVGKLAKIGKETSKIGAELEPLNLARALTAKTTKIIPDSKLINVYRKGVKFGKSIDEVEQFKTSKVALENEIMPTRKGLRKIQEKINDLNDTINKKIQKAAYQGHRFNIDDIYQDIDRISNIMKRNTDQPKVIDNAVKLIKKNWKENIKVGQTRNPLEIQKIKQNIYADLKSFYEQFSNTPAKQTLRKQIAKNAKKMLESIIPEIKQLNREEGDLIRLYENIEGRANVISNRDIIDFGMAMRTGVGGAVGGMVAGAKGAEVGAKVGMLEGILNNAKVRARLAIIINNMKKKGIKIRNLPTLIRLGLYEASETQEANK